MQIMQFNIEPGGYVYLVGCGVFWIALLVLFAISFFVSPKNPDDSPNIKGGGNG